MRKGVCRGFGGGARVCTADFDSSATTSDTKTTAGNRDIFVSQFGAGGEYIASYTMGGDQCPNSDRSVNPEGDATTGETPVPPGDEEAAWEAFFEWSMARCWGSDCGTTGAEQFAAMVAKMQELGLTVEFASP